MIGKGLIISGGENIDPAEVEAALVDLPGVDSCAVFGVPDDKQEEVPHAAVVLTGEVRLSEHDSAGFLGTHRRYEIPKSFAFLDEIPRNASSGSSAK